MFSTSSLMSYINKIAIIISVQKLLEDKEFLLNYRYHFFFVIFQWYYCFCCPFASFSLYCDFILSRSVLFWCLRFCLKHFFKMMMIKMMIVLCDTALKQCNLLDSCESQPSISKGKYCYFLTHTHTHTLATTLRFSTNFTRQIFLFYFFLPFLRSATNFQLHPHCKSLKW